MTPEQLRQFARFCSAELLGPQPQPPRLALRLVMLHYDRHTPATWLPNILYAHGLPRYARALDEILAR